MVVVVIVVVVVAVFNLFPFLFLLPRLDVKNSAIIVDGFKRHPSASSSPSSSPSSLPPDSLALGLLPAEACGLITPGDELVGISNHALQGANTTTTTTITITITNPYHITPSICHTIATTPYKVFLSPLSLTPFAPPISHQHNPNNPR